HQVDLAVPIKVMKRECRRLGDRRLTTCRANKTPLRRFVGVSWRKISEIKPPRIEDVGRIAEGCGLTTNRNVHLREGLHAIAEGRTALMPRKGLIARVKVVERRLCQNGLHAARDRECTPETETAPRAK